MAAELAVVIAHGAGVEGMLVELRVPELVVGGTGRIWWGEGMGSRSMVLVGASTVIDDSGDGGAGC